MIRVGAIAVGIACAATIAAMLVPEARSPLIIVGLFALVGGLGVLVPARADRR